MGRKKHTAYLNTLTPPSDIDFRSLCLTIRSTLGAGQREIAELLGVPLRTYQDWEAGAEPKGQAAAKILWLKDRLGLPIEDFLLKEKEIA